MPADGISLPLKRGTSARSPLGQARRLGYINYATERKGAPHPPHDAAQIAAHLGDGRVAQAAREALPGRDPQGLAVAASVNIRRKARARKSIDAKGFCRALRPSGLPSPLRTP